MPQAESIRKYDGMFYDWGGLWRNVLHLGIDMDPTGSTTNSAKLQAAIDEFPDDNSRKVLVFPPGTYLLDSEIYLRRRNLSLLAPGGAKFQKGTSINYVFNGSTGNCDGLRVYGFEADLNRSAFTDGADLTSFIFLCRASDIKIRQCYIHNFSEECLKFYKTKNVEISYNRFEDGFDNGVQLHNPENDNYSGSGPDQGSDNIIVAYNTFRNIDDLTFGAGNGIGVTVQATSPTQTIKNVRIIGNLFEDCLRAAWGEIVDVWAENIHLIGNTSNRSIGTAFGVVGARGVTMQGNVAYNPGMPGILSSEVAGFQLASGNNNTPAKGCIISGNTAIDDRVGAAREMMYGVVVNSGEDIHIGSNTIIGAKVRKVWSIAWGFTTGNVVDVDDPPAAEVGLSSGVTLQDRDVIGSGGYFFPTWNVVEYDTEAKDDGTDGLFDTSIASDRFCIKRPGRYQVLGVAAIAYGAVAGGNSGEIRARIELNSATVTEVKTTATTITTEETGITVQAMDLVCAPGDQIKFGLWQDTGNDMTIVNTRSSFKIRRVGP